MLGGDIWKIPYVYRFLFLKASLIHHTFKMTNLFVLDNFLVPVHLYKEACKPGIFPPSEVQEVRFEPVLTLGRTERLRN